MKEKSRTMAENETEGGIEMKWQLNRVVRKFVWKMKKLCSKKRKKETWNEEVLIDGQKDRSRTDEGLEERIQNRRTRNNQWWKKEEDKVCSNKNKWARLKKYVSWEKWEIINEL